MCLKFDGEAPLELIRWNLAERFGWTLEYVDALSWQDMAELNQIDDGRMRAR